MKTFAALLILAASPAFAAAQATKEDLKKLSKGGVSDDVILNFIKRKGFPGKLSSDDLVELKDAGLSERVLGELLAGPAAPAGKSESPGRTYSWGSLGRGGPYNYRGSYSYAGYSPYYWSYGYPYYRPYSNPYYSHSYYRPYYPYYRPYYRPYYGSYYRPTYGARYYRGGYVRY